MLLDHQNMQHGSIRLHLLASLLLHGFLALIVSWLMAGQTRQLKPPPTITIVNLTAERPAESITARQPAPASVKSATPPHSIPAPQTDIHTLTRPTTTLAQQTRNESSSQPKITASDAQIQASPEMVPHQVTLSKKGGDTDQITDRKAPSAEVSFGTAKGPAFKKQVLPIYPPLAKRRGKEGTVLLRISINETGQLTWVETLEDPGYGLAEAAQDAIRNSSFTPAHHNGKPVAIRALLPVRFKLHQGL